MARHYSDFLTAYLEYSAISEPPLQYHIWTCLSVIAAALQRRIYLSWGFKTLYPNLYVVLIGPSGARKGTAMGIGKDLLCELSNIKVTSESITREALIRDMRDNITTFNDPTTATLTYQSAMTVFSEELSVFLGQGNTKFLADLTDWFDCADKWEYRTKGTGVDQLVGICLNLLGATAPDWLRSILPAEAFGGGFTSRILFVVEEGKRQLVADPRIPEPIRQMRKGLVHDLEQIALLSGEMKFEPETMEVYREWYIDNARNPPIKDPHFSGYCERRAVHCLKLSMVCSASRGNDRRILPEDFERARHLLGAIEPKMPRTFMGLGKARYSEMTQLIYDYLERKGKATSSEILNKFHLDLDEYTMKIVMQTLAMRKVIKVTYNAASGEYGYEYISKGEQT